MYMFGTEFQRVIVLTADNGPSILRYISIIVMNIRHQILKNAHTRDIRRVFVYALSS